MEDPRDHRDEHEGCKVMWPWLRWCSKYRYASDLARQALKDIEDMPSEELDGRFRRYKEGHDVWKHRSDARAKYIMHLEGWMEHEEDMVRDSSEYLIEVHGPNPRWFEGRSFEEEVEYRMFTKRQIHAIQFLYAYNMFNPRTGKIELDRLKKLN